MFLLNEPTRWQLFNVRRLLEDTLDEILETEVSGSLRSNKIRGMKCLVKKPREIIIWQNTKSFSNERNVRVLMKHTKP